MAAFANLLEDIIYIPSSLFSQDTGLWFQISIPSEVLGTEDTKDGRGRCADPSVHRNAPAAHGTNALKNFNEEELVHYEQRVMLGIQNHLTSRTTAVGFNIASTGLFFSRHWIGCEFKSLS